MEDIILVVAYWLAQAHDHFRNSTAGRMVNTGTLDYAWDRIQMFELIMKVRNSRDARLPARKRTHYRRHERMEILIIKERFGLSIAEASRYFQVSANTISNWLKSVREGDSGLARTEPPANKLPELIRQVARVLKLEHPKWGSPKLAAVLTNMALKCSPTSVRRFLQGRLPRHRPNRKNLYTGWIKAKFPNRVWVQDWTTVRCLFTTIEIGTVNCAYSRKVLAIRAYKKRPTTADALSLLRLAMGTSRAKPEFLITDKGQQFKTAFKKEVRDVLHIKHRYRKVGDPNLSRLDRFWRSLKQEYANGMFIWRSQLELTKALRRYAAWFNNHRPHEGIDCQTPSQRHARKKPKKTFPRSEGVLIRENFQGDRKLPVYRIGRAA